jgi:hypothetical protein
MKVAAYLATFAVLLLASAAPDADRLTDAPPYGLSCDRCQREPATPCGAMANMPIAAVVIGASQVDEHVACTVEDPNPDDASDCFSTRTWRFREVRFLRGPPSARARDVFQTASYYPYFEPERRRGIVLRPQTRYALFAAPAHSSSEPPAQWRVSFACELPSGEPFPPSTPEN